jgi:pyruvate/2-oxoacid:ferredoxin oxidoreductase alpha subunit
MLQVPRVAKRLTQQYAAILGRSYPLVEACALEEAATVVVAAGSAAQTIKSVLPALNNSEGSTGLLRLRLFRPLPAEEIVSLLARPHIRRVVVVDRDLSAGLGGIFAQELRALLQGSSFEGKIYELNLAGGVDLTPRLLRRGLEAAAAGSGEQGRIIWGVDL